MDAGANFPPGSIGAQKAGCLCTPDDISLECPLHGLDSALVFAALAIERRLAEDFERRSRRAKQRFSKAAPLAVLALAIPSVVSIEFPLWVAECILWAGIVAFSLMRWSWWGQ